MAFDVEDYKRSLLDLNQSLVMDYKDIKFVCAYDDMNKMAIALCLITDAESLLTKMMINANNLSYLTLDDYTSIQGTITKNINKNNDDQLYVFPATINDSEDVVGVLIKSTKLSVSAIADKMIQVIRLVTMVK
jgi:hypothetical protein